MPRLLRRRRSRSGTSCRNRISLLRPLLAAGRRPTRQAMSSRTCRSARALEPLQVGRPVLQRLVGGVGIDDVVVGAGQEDRRRAARPAAADGRPARRGSAGKTAAPSGTLGLRVRRLMSASGHGGDDGQLVAVLDRRGQVVEIANVLVVEIEVDEAAHLAVVEQTRWSRPGYLAPRSSSTA